MKLRAAAIPAVVFALVLTGLAIPAPAFASGTGTVTIELETPSGAALARSNVLVNVIYKHGSTIVYDIGMDTDPSGHATFVGVPAGVSLSSSSESGGGYVGATKSGFSVASGGTKVEKVPFAVGATVTGLLTENGFALHDVTVALLNSSGTLEYSATTTGAGAYSIAGVRTGSYRVQFNSRMLFTPATGAAYEWAYWRGTTHASTTNWTSATALVLKQQLAHSSASIRTGIDGNVSAGVTLTAAVNYWTPATSHSGQIVHIVGVHAADAIRASLDGTGNLSTAVNPGKYRIGITGDFDPILATYPIYWYRTDTGGPTASESKATWVTVTATKAITFIKQPTIS